MLLKTIKKAIHNSPEGAGFDSLKKCQDPDAIDEVGKVTPSNFRAAKSLWILCGMVFAWYGHSCQTSPQSSNQDAFALESEDDGTQHQQAQYKGQTTKGLRKHLSKMHPERPDAWHTRKIIMTNTQPDPQFILKCKESIEGLTNKATNYSDLQAATISMTSEVSKSTQDYHWCFYQLMTDLDLKMDQDAPLLTDKSETFLSRIKALWVLGRSLEVSKKMKKPIYSSYLRTRYMELSESKFGRKIEELDEGSLLVTAGKEGKPARLFEDQ